MLSLCKKRIRDNKEMLSMCNRQLSGHRDNNTIEHIMDQCKLDIVYFKQLINGMRKFIEFVSEKRDNKRFEASAFKAWLVELREAAWNVYNYKERRNIMKAKVKFFLGVPIPWNMTKKVSFKHYMLGEFIDVVMVTLQNTMTEFNLSNMGETTVCIRSKTAVQATNTQCIECVEKGSKRRKIKQ